MLGGCISRDFLRISNADNFELVDYFARTGFASLGAKPIKDEALIESIESKFQKTNVERDLTKSLFKELGKKEFDVFLIDLIGEKNDLVSYQGSYCTKSSEFRKYQNKKYRSIKFDSEEKWEKWELGVTKFFKFTDKLGVTSKIRVSRLFWTEDIEGGGEFSKEKKDYITRNNVLLNKMYKHINSYIGEEQFLDYPKSLLVADPQHKWGLEPFHYTSGLYIKTKELLENSLKSAD